MYFDSAFRCLGTIDPQPLVRAVESFGEGAWDEFEARQQSFGPHRFTQTIPLVFDMDGRHTNPTIWPRFDQIKPALEPVLDTIAKANPPELGNGQDGYFIRIILTRLRAGADIRPHKDDGFTLERSHRYHLALNTNKLVEFEVDGQVRHFGAGEIWEINNRQTHAVRNRSEEGRVHMILDYVVPGEKIQDPTGLLIA